MVRKNEREPMTQEERKLLEANKRLVEKQKFLEMDIRSLIAYIKGNKYLEEQVNEIINYYTNDRGEKNENIKK